MLSPLPACVHGPLCSGSFSPARMPFSRCLCSLSSPLSCFSVDSFPCSSSFPYQPLLRAHSSTSPGGRRRRPSTAASARGSKSRGPKTGSINKEALLKQDKIGMQENIDEDEAESEECGDPHHLEAMRAELKEKMSKLLSNAQRLKQGYGPRYSLGVDFGDARTGVAVSKGFAPRPVEVLALQGPKLEARLLDIAQKERADEFIVGLPKSSSGLETHQSNKVRSFAGRLAVRAANRGWRVYLHDEFGSTEDALDFMIAMGSTRKGRRNQIDAYSAVMLLRSYFDNVGNYAELVIPKNLAVQQCLCQGPSMPISDDDFYQEDSDLSC